MNSLKRLWEFFLILLVIISLLKPKVGLRPFKTSLVKKIAGHIGLFINGIYKGLIHSGASILKSYIFIYLFGQTYLESSGTRKLPSLIASILSIIIFLQANLIVWNIGFVLMGGHLIGSYLGAHYALKKGENWMKYAFTIVVALSAGELLLK